VPTIIHTADVHLGAPLGWLGDRAGDQREQLRQTFRKIIDLTREEDADCLLVAGDLFDNNRPPASVVRFVLRELSRLTDSCEAHVVLLPGSHDHAGDESVYECYGNEFAQIDRVSVLAGGGASTVRIPRAGLALHGRPATANRSSERQMSALRPDTESNYNVAVLHGSVDIVPCAPDDHPISREELRASGWSYVALGHWHSWKEIAAADAPAVYPGAPEIVAPDQTGSGSVARVAMGRDGTRVSQVRVGARQVADVSIDVAGAQDTVEVARRIRSAAPAKPDTILRAVLTGVIPIDSSFDVRVLLEDLRGDYFHVLPPKQSYHVRLTDADLDALPERLVIGRYVRLMRESIASAGSERERAELEGALQMGVALLQGKDVLS
jgi:exonuclease SbcD